MASLPPAPVRLRQVSLAATREAKRFLIRPEGGSDAAFGPQENLPIPCKTCRLSGGQRTKIAGPTELSETSKMIRNRPPTRAGFP
jgi:hypothetical protein